MCAKKPKSQKPSERAFSARDLYPGLTGKLPRSESIAQLAEYVLALYGRLSELVSAAQVFEEATDPPGYQTIYEALQGARPVAKAGQRRTASQWDGINHSNGRAFVTSLKKNENPAFNFGEARRDSTREGTCHQNLTFNICHQYYLYQLILTGTRPARKPRC